MYSDTVIHTIYSIIILNWHNQIKLTFALSCVVMLCSVWCYEGLANAFGYHWGFGYFADEYNRSPLQEIDNCVHKKLNKSQSIVDLCTKSCHQIDNKPYHGIWAAKMQGLFAGFWFDPLLDIQYMDWSRKQPTHLYNTHNMPNGTGHLLISRMIPYVADLRGGGGGGGIKMTQLLSTVRSFINTRRHTSTLPQSLLT